MDIDKIIDEIQNMAVTDDVAVAAHSYVNALIALEELYKYKVKEICGEIKDE